MICGCYHWLRLFVVCYNEAGEEQLDNYVEELQAAGELTQQKEEIITQLKTQQANLTSDKAAEMDNKQISFNAKQSHVSKISLGCDPQSLK